MTDQVIAHSAAKGTIHAPVSPSDLTEWVFTLTDSEYQAAAIAIVLTRELGFPEEIVNVEGAAVAQGHPIGATGAGLTTKLIHSMRRDGLKRGIVTLCIGGGQGIALAIEAVH